MRPLQIRDLDCDKPCREVRWASKSPAEERYGKWRWERGSHTVEVAEALA